MSHPDIQGDRRLDSGWKSEGGLFKRQDIERMIFWVVVKLKKEKNNTYAHQYTECTVALLIRVVMTVALALWLTAEVGREREGG